MHFEIITENSVFLKAKNMKKYKNVLSQNLIVLHVVRVAECPLLPHIVGHLVIHKWSNSS